MFKTILVSLLLLTAITQPLLSSGRKDNNRGAGLTLRGRLILTGNEPHTQLIMESVDKRKYKLTGELVNEMNKAAPGQTVQVYGFISEGNPGALPTNSFNPPLFEVHSWKGDNKNLLPDRKPGS